MADNLKGIPFSSDEEGIDVPRMARELVYEQAYNLGVDKDFPGFDINSVYVVWFAFTLGNWKALCATSAPDGRYYEVTYNAAKHEAYVDTYRKTHNIAVPFKPRSK